MSSIPNGIMMVIMILGWSLGRLELISESDSGHSVRSSARRAPCDTCFSRLVAFHPVSLRTPELFYNFISGRSPLDDLDEPDVLAMSNCIVVVRSLLSFSGLIAD